MESSASSKTRSPGGYSTVMNGNDNVSVTSPEDVQEAIEDWLRWSAADGINIGYPKVSILAKVIEQGGYIRSPGKVGMPIDTESRAERMDRYIGRLTMGDRKKILILVLEFGRRGNQQSKARQVGCSLPWYRQQLAVLLSGLRAYLDAERL